MKGPSTSLATHEASASKQSVQKYSRSYSKDAWRQISQAVRHESTLGWHQDNFMDEVIRYTCSSKLGALIAAVCQHLEDSECSNLFCNINMK